MKKLTLISLLVLIFTPMLAFSSENLASKLKGKILLAVEDKGKTYYVHSDGNRYLITKDTAQKVFEKLSVGVKDSDLRQIPTRDLGVVTSADKIVYINKCDTTSYSNEISRLKLEVENLKAKNNLLSATVGSVSNNESSIANLKKDYSLKINILQDELIQLDSLKLRNQDIISYLKSNTYEDLTKVATNLFQQSVLGKMQQANINLVTNADENISRFLDSQKPAIQNEINNLKNELDRKILELN